jgi:hypothetical protein
MDSHKIREACFAVATTLMWQKDTVAAEQINEHMAELSETTEKLYQIAIENLELIKGLGGTEEMVVRAINYLDAVHAFPRRTSENYSWFDDTLFTLLSLACPNFAPGKDAFPFFKDIINGIAKQ